MQSGEHLWPAAALPGFQPMTDKTDETGKGPYRPGEAPKRPYATIDLQATEIGGQRSQAGTAGDARSETKGGTPRLPIADALARAWTAFAGALRTAWGVGLRLARNHAFLSHAAAGVAGAALTLALTALLGLIGPGGERDLAKRLATVEKALQQRPALPGDVAARLAGADARFARLEGQLQAAQTKLSADAKAIEARIAASDMTERTAQLEAALASLTADKPGSARLADVEKLLGEASEAKAASVRMDQDVARLRGELQSLRQNLDALKGAMEEQLKHAAKAGDIAPAMAKLAAFERALQGVLKTESARAAGAQQLLLALEVSNLRRALDRGDSYAHELDAVRKVAAGSIDLAALDRDSRTGVPTLGVLTLEFRRTANAAVDAERERPDASVLDRLMSGARSIVRWRRASYDADDASAEAVLSRMESALKEGNPGEVLAQGRRLPPKAARAAEDWLRRLEARTAADRAIADIEAALKASLAGGPPSAAPEATR
jgi:hypothetical protein